MAAIGNTCILIVQGRPRSRAGRGGGARPKGLSESRTCFPLGEAPPPLAGTRPAVAAEGVSRGRSGARGGGGGSGCPAAREASVPQLKEFKISTRPCRIRCWISFARHRLPAAGRWRGTETGFRPGSEALTDLAAGRGRARTGNADRQPRRDEGERAFLPLLATTPDLPDLPDLPRRPRRPRRPGAKPGRGPGGRAGADGGTPEAAIARPLPRPGGRPPWGPAGLGSPWGGGPRWRAGGWRLLLSLPAEVIPEGGQAGRGGACGGGDRGGNPGPRTRASPKSPPDAVNSSVCVWAAGRGGGAQEPGR